MLNEVAEHFRSHVGCHRLAICQQLDRGLNLSVRLFACAPPILAVDSVVSVTRRDHNRRHDLRDDVELVPQILWLVRVASIGHHHHHSSLKVVADAPVETPLNSIRRTPSMMLIVYRPSMRSIENLPS